MIGSSHWELLLMGYHLYKYTENMRQLQKKSLKVFKTLRDFP